jgi:hypothetical protein
MMTPRLSVLMSLLLLSVVARLVPYALSHLGVSIDPADTIYPWNFSPILPICLFGGACYAQPRLAYAVPFATFLLGDLGIWALTGRADWAFYAYQPVVYLSVALVVTTGFALRGQRSWRGVAGAGLVSSVGFFVVTNFGLWAFGDGSIYPQTLDGLVDCYVRAIPYLRNTVISMALFLPLLFSPVALKNVGPVAPALAVPGR